MDTLDDVLMLLDAGTALRHVASTKMNEVSSRSHCFFKLKLGKETKKQRYSFVRSFCSGLIFFTQPT